MVIFLLNNFIIIIVLYYQARLGEESSSKYSLTYIIYNIYTYIHIAIDIKTIDGSRWHGRSVGVMVSYLRFLMNSKKIYRQIILFQRIYYISVSLTGLPCAQRPIYKEFHRPPTSTHLHIYTSIQQLRLVNILFFYCSTNTYLFHLFFNTQLNINWRIIRKWNKNNIIKM